MLQEMRPNEGTALQLFPPNQRLATLRISLLQKYLPEQERVVFRGWGRRGDRLSSPALASRRLNGGDNIPNLVVRLRNGSTICEELFLFRSQVLVLRSTGEGEQRGVLKLLD